MRKTLLRLSPILHQSLPEHRLTIRREMMCRIALALVFVGPNVEDRPR